MTTDDPEHRDPGGADDRVSDEDAMRLAIAAARQAGDRGDVPVGAVALHEGKVVALAGNARERDHDPMAHAELLVLREAARHRHRWRLEDCTVVVTLEPCPMCAGALVAGRVGRLVYGAADPKAGAVGSLYNLCADPRLNHEVEVRSGVLADECATVLREFFATRRQRAGTGDGQPGR